MRRADLLALAARVEALSGPDRSVDQDVARAVGWQERGGHWNAPGGARPWGYSWLDIPHYTASLDAAMALVPAGMPWMLIRHENGMHYSEVGLEGPQIIAATPALALLAAALRARAEEVPHEDV